jgi:hypothetical protein
LFVDVVSCCEDGGSLAGAEDCTCELPLLSFRRGGALPVNLSRKLVQFNMVWSDTSDTGSVVAVSELVLAGLSTAASRRRRWEKHWPIVMDRRRAFVRGDAATVNDKERVVL